MSDACDTGKLDRSKYFIEINELNDYLISLEHNIRTLNNMSNWVPKKYEDRRIKLTKAEENRKQTLHDMCKSKIND